MNGFTRFTSFTSGQRNPGTGTKAISASNATKPSTAEKAKGERPPKFSNKMPPKKGPSTNAAPTTSGRSPKYTSSLWLFHYHRMTSYCQESPNSYSSFRARRSSILSKLAALVQTWPWKTANPTRHLTIPPELRTATQLVSMAPLDARKPPNVCTIPIISNPGDTSKMWFFSPSVHQPF